MDFLRLDVGADVYAGSQAPAWEPSTRSSSFAKLDRKLELPRLHSQAGAWERAKMDRRLIGEREMSEFFAMGGYAFYVWTSYGLTFVLMFIGVIKPLLANKRILRGLLLKRKREKNG